MVFTGPALRLDSVTHDKSLPRPKIDQTPKSTSGNPHGYWIDELSLIFVKKKRGRGASGRTLIQFSRNTLPYENIDELNFIFST